MKTFLNILTGFLILVMMACNGANEKDSKPVSPCEDPTDIYCLLEHYYLPEIRYRDTPVLLFEYGVWYNQHKEFETLVRPYLRDSLGLTEPEIDYMDSSLNTIPISIHTSEDFKRTFFLHDTSWVWDAGRLPRFKSVSHLLVDSVNHLFFDQGYAPSRQLAKQLFPVGYITLSKPVMNKEGTVIHLYEQYYNRSENDYTRFFIFYRDKKLGWQMKMLF